MRLGARSVLVAVLLAGAAGCGGGGTPADPATTPNPPPGGSQTTGRTFTNPVHGDNFPDPGVLRAGGTYYAYSTNSSAENVPTLTSPDLVTWTDGPDALPDVGTWAVGGNTWAPEVIAAGGRYLLFYTARSIATGRQCIGR